MSMGSTVETAVETVGLGGWCPGYLMASTTEMSMIQCRGRPLGVDEGGDRLGVDGRRDGDSSLWYI